MADQVEVPKLVQYVLVGLPPDNVNVSKLVMYAWAVPSSSGDDSNRQGHVHTQIIVRR